MTRREKAYDRKVDELMKKIGRLEDREVENVLRLLESARRDIAASVAFLASEDCELTGEIWSVGGGSVSRFFIGLTDGYFKHPSAEGGLTIEDVAEHVDQIRAETGYLVPASNQDEFVKLAAKFNP